MNIYRYPGIFFVNIQEKDNIIQFLKDNNIQLFIINCENVTTSEEFINEARKVLPLEPPLYSGYSLDAFEDSLCEGLDVLQIKKVAILLTQIDSFFNINLQEFMNIILTLYDIKSKIADISTGIIKPTSLVTFLLGEDYRFMFLEKFFLDIRKFV